ncbi:DUF6252 family protein [Flavobacterium saccharophilum]|uniref:Type IV secretion system putative lipoprotein virB7 n=1 Tax=Flavobacterium saccharophilum TaxID=29534 RepID=A0A1M7ALV8_9FLAO|nr:DUF6252 family protein [Flavobacterium saccharophilum]SHL43744.1 hypothetical protein SAMN05444366_0732 [Flavobacterium saccharophilum]
MKKIFYFLSLLFILTSCTEDIKFNNPAFQGLKDNVFWRAQSYSATTDANKVLQIEGSLGTDVVILKVSSTTPKTYVLGIDDITVASYSNLFSVDEPEFTTGTNKGSGQIVITDFDAENNTISGTFKFTAPNVNEEDLEKPSLNFKEGVFYKIPITPNLKN